MKRLATTFGIFFALTAISSSAQAGSYGFVIGGHRFHVDAPRNCRSASCVSISQGRAVRPADDVDTTPVASLPPAAVPAPQPACPATVTLPQPAVAVSPIAPPAPAPVPVVAAATSQPVILPPSPQLAPPRIDPPQAPAAEPPRVAAPRPDIKPAVSISQGDDEPADTPLGRWESAGAKGTVRIERCGPALCGYALTDASTRGESVLVNMKPKSNRTWTGSIYSRASGNTYYATMTLKGSGKLRVEACALGHFFCSGKDWRRVDEPRERLITTSQPWSARS